MAVKENNKVRKPRKIFFACFAQVDDESVGDFIEAAKADEAKAKFRKNNNLGKNDDVFVLREACRKVSTGTPPPKSVSIVISADDIDYLPGSKFKAEFSLQPDGGEPDWEVLARPIEACTDAEGIEYGEGELVELNFKKKLKEKAVTPRGTFIVPKSRVVEI